MWSGSSHVAPLHCQFSPSLGGQGVEVEHDLPRGVVLSVLVERRATPDPALVAAVAPEVIVERTVLADIGDAFVRVQDGEQTRFERGQCVTSAERLGALDVAAEHPLHRLLARDLLEPLVGVFRGLGWVKLVGWGHARGWRGGFPIARLGVLVELATARQRDGVDAHAER